MSRVRPPAVAGSFYPGGVDELAAAVDGMLAEATVALAPAPAPRALISPHAGYVYSGTTAALAYASVQPARGRITRVVLLGPVHRVPVRGCALSGADAFQTPLGRVPVAAAPGLEELPQVSVRPDAHGPEHSLEVQIPFLQRALGDFELLPIAVGDATADEVCQVIEAAGGGEETLVVVSSDLSHYLGYDEARTTDNATLGSILALEGPISHDQACGGTPINGLLLAALHADWRPRLLGACNSGDTAGSHDRVVGYAAVAFDGPTRDVVGATDAAQP